MSTRRWWTGLLLLAALLAICLPVSAEEAGPAPDVRERPPEPPPPGGAMADWDQDFRSRGTGLGPPLPPPDPFAPRPIRGRHDIREVSLDARLKAVKRVPQWVDVIERSAITEWRPLDLGDFARRLPNVIVADGGSPFLQLPLIRGLGGTRVKVMTDGVWPVNDVLGLQGATLSLWDPESTERMEIFHGPGAYLKGIDSPGGMINIVPRRPRRHGRLSADATGAVGFDLATEAFRGRAEVDVGRGRWAALAGATWTTRGDRRIGGGDTLEDTSFSQFAADLALDYFIDNRSRVGITVQYNQAYDIQSPHSVASDLTRPSYERFFIALTLTSFDTGGIFSGTRASISLDTIFADTDDEFGDLDAGISGQSDAERYQFNLQGNLYLHPCHDTWAELTVAYAHLDREETLFGDCNVCCDPDRPADTNDLPSLDRWTASLRSGAGGSTFAEIAPCTQVLRKYEAEEMFVSLLVEDQVHTECTDIHAGLRFDAYYVADNRVGKDEWNFLVGGAGGIARHLSPRHTVYANASAGWRRPTLDERHATSVIDGTTIFGDADLDPELTVNGELGLKGSLKNRASYQLAGFVHHFEDFIAPVDATPLVGPTQVLTNAGEVTTYGGELSLAWRPWPTFEGAELYGSAGITRSSNTELVANVPFLWRTGCRYSVPQPRGYRVRRWFADLAFHGATNSEYRNVGGESYVTAECLFGGAVDLGCFHRTMLNIGVTNLFDAAYVPAASRLPAPGISLMAGFQIDI